MAPSIRSGTELNWSTPRLATRSRSWPEVTVAGQGALAATLLPTWRALRVPPATAVITPD